MTWPSNVAVAMPTVPQREALRQQALAQWRNFGVEPLVSMQDPTWPLCHQSHTRHVNLLLRQVLGQQPAATHVLLVEDDTELAPELPRVLPTLLDGRTWSLWAPGLTFLPSDVKHALREGRPLPGRLITWARPLRQWHGTIAVLLPRATVEAVTAWQSDLAGWDVVLREWLARNGQRLWLTVPDLVEHRGTVSTVAPRGTSGFSRSASFRWPIVDGGS